MRQHRGSARLGSADSAGARRGCGVCVSAGARGRGVGGERAVSDAQVSAFCTPPLTTKSPTTHHYQSYATRNPSKSACHEDLTPPHAGAHRTPPPARHRLTSGSSGRARPAMIASQMVFRLGLGLASPKRKGTRRRHCLRSSIGESSFKSKRCRQRRIIQGTLPVRHEADIHIHTISTTQVSLAEERAPGGGIACGA